MEIFLLTLRLALAVVFGVAGIAKLFDPMGSEKAFGDFGLPKALARPMVYVLPIFELAIAAALLFVQSSWFGAVGAAGLFLIFTAGMLYQMAKGKSPDCHCFGQIHSEPVGVSSIVRNILMLIPAVFLVAQGISTQGTDLIITRQDFTQFGIGIVLMVLLLAAVLLLRKISEQQDQIVRRIEIMELVGREGGSVEREAIGHPREGLTIGALIPDFDLPDLDGQVVTLDLIKADAKPVLFIFVSPTCSPCRAMVPRFDKWQNELEDKVNFVFISNRDPDDNREKFGSVVTKRILLQNETEISDLFRAKWTPMAVLMDVNGRVASFTGAGDIGITELIEKISAERTIQEFTYFTDAKITPTPIMIGQSVPDFSLTDLHGNSIDRSYFKEKPTLLTFWSPSCSYCQSMMEEIQEWDDGKNGSDVNLLVFSDGEREAHVALGLKSPLVLDKGLNTAAKLGMFSTPSAIVVDENGNFVSETAIGSDDIWALIGKRK